jgi:glycogen debranching enzyme
VTATGLQGVIRVEDRFYILASSSRVDDRTRVLKHDDTFAVFDRFGDVAPVGLGELGVYHEGTRFLSRLAVTLDGERPLLLSSTVTSDNSVLTVDLTNPDLARPGGTIVPRGTLHLSREQLLWRGVFYERLRIANYGREPLQARLEIQVAADFADIFEVRGTQRPRRGECLAVTPLPHGFAIPYVGLDRRTRRLRVQWVPDPTVADGGGVRYDLNLAPAARVELGLAFACDVGDTRPETLPFEEAELAAAGERRTGREQLCEITTSSEQFDGWVHRSLADLNMMITPTPEGPYPYAGVPWFSTPFGRDGLITARQMLWMAPEVARGVLAFLAARQADHSDPATDAEPGKILHEMRGGEMAALGEVPFGCYYGSVDATPLFVMLAGDYLVRTGDLDFARALWPHVVRALEWMTGPGDADGDGFIEYFRRSPKGLTQQGWKDSGDSVFHADGTLAEGPIALCEVQGYAFAAYRSAARIATALGDRAHAEALAARAARLQERFDRAFWLENLDTYALALDGAKRPCEVRASNAGHCLFTGIAPRGHAERVARTLMDPSSFSGWGIRTLATGQPRYNPMSYHNGSVWPHDNSMVAAGLARYGHQPGVRALLSGMYEASQFVELHRLPELFCGFECRQGAGPTLYPVACSPQAWASGALLLLLEASLGLIVEGGRERIVFRRGSLPPWLQQMWIRNLRVGRSTLDLALEQYPNDLGVNVLRRDGPVEVVSVK